jgi:hypothetical protein
LWSTVTPISFDPPLAGEEAKLRIRFVQDNRGSQVLGTTAGSISRSPNGALVGSASIEIDCDNKLFVDRFREPDRLPALVGPFDLVGVIGHEVGHALGLDHPVGNEPSLMSASNGEDAVRRALFPLDIREVQQRHRAILLAESVKSNLQETGQLIDASPGVQLQKGSFGLVTFGPMGTRTFLDMMISARGHLVNAVRLKFTTLTKNVFVNRVELFDGIIPVQRFAVSARNNGNEGLRGTPWDLRLGLLRRRKMGNPMLVRMEVFFTAEGGQPQSEFGVLQLEEASADTVIPAPVINVADSTN